MGPEPFDDGARHVVRVVRRVVNTIDDEPSGRVGVPALGERVVRVPEPVVISNVAANQSKIRLL